MNVNSWCHSVAYYDMQVLPLLCCLWIEAQKKVCSGSILSSNPGEPHMDQGYHKNSACLLKKKKKQNRQAKDEHFVSLTYIKSGLKWCTTAQNASPFLQEVVKFVTLTPL